MKNLRQFIALALSIIMIIGVMTVSAGAVPPPERVTLTAPQINTTTPSKQDATTSETPKDTSQPAVTNPEPAPDLPISETIGYTPPAGKTYTYTPTGALMRLIDELRDAYFLEARVNTLKDYSYYSEHSILCFSNEDMGNKSILDRLSPENQAIAKQLSTYQALVHIQGTPEYAASEELRTYTDREFEHFTSFYPSYIRRSLAGFVDSHFADALDPDELNVIGDAVTHSAPYQDLKNTLEYLVGFYNEDAITAQLSPTEILLHIDEVTKAAEHIWPEYSALHELPIGATGG